MRLPENPNPARLGSEPEKMQCGHPLTSLGYACKECHAAEVERLREALERASGYALQGIHEPYPAPRFYCKAIRKIARAALGEVKGGGA